jgi:hypothetical protein
LFVLRRAQLQPLKSVAKIEEVDYERKDSEISLWNAKEARQSAKKAWFHNVRKWKEVLDVDGGRLFGGVSPRCRRHEDEPRTPGGAGLTGKASGLSTFVIG